MPGPESRAEIIDQKPFVIRGHHLRYYTLLVMGTSPSELAGTIRRSTENPSLEVQYVDDVLGPGGNQADRFEENLRTTFKTFLDLPDSCLAEIVEGIPDTICGGCAIGEHCRKLFDNDQVGKRRFEKDGRIIDSVLEDLGILNLPKPIISREKAHFSDTKPHQVRRLKTTVGAIKKIFKHEPSRDLYLFGQ